MTINLFDGIPDNFLNYSKELQNYLNDVWKNRPLFLNEDEDEEEKRSSEQKFFNFYPNKIQPRNYVGFVQFGDLRINIYPRVFYNRPTILADTNAYLIISHVLKWLQYGSRLHFPFNEFDTNLQKQDDWLEALIYLFATYTSETLNSAPYFNYQEITEEMAFMRGRIAIQPYINHNLAKGRHHLLHCTYEPFLYDNLFNRIVKHTCRILSKVTENGLNKMLLNEILFLLDEVEDVYCTAEDCNKVQINRLHKEVGTITNMCAAFLSNQAYNDGSADKQNLCILLPMEVIFEQYIAGFLENEFKDLKVKSQASNMYVATTGVNFSEDVFRMKHDILIDEKLIIDTKYKFRKKENDLKGGVNQSDLYQMVTYCFRRKIKRGILLYPSHYSETANNELFSFKVEDIYIDAYSIDITEDDLDNFKDKQKNKLMKILITYKI